MSTGLRLLGEQVTRPHLMNGTRKELSASLPPRLAQL